MDCAFNLLIENSLMSTQDLSYTSLRMSSSPQQTQTSLGKEISDEVTQSLSVTASDAAMFEDINEVLEAVMHEDG